jgi:serine phosphatase RsbU (regulator of sigma subunit)
MKEGNWELIEIKADKQPIGIHFTHTYPFTLHTIDVLPHDRIYLFTDGYADQFGGANGRKLTYGRFKKIILHAQEHPITAQKEILYHFLSEWKKNYAQVDDITVVGIEINEDA